MLFELLLQTNPFGPVQTPTPTPSGGAGFDDVSTTTLYLIALGVLIVLVAIGYFISRDARRSLPRGAREELDREAPIPDLSTDQRTARSKKARSKHKAARRARRRNR